MNLWGFGQGRLLNSPILEGTNKHGTEEADPGKDPAAISTFVDQMWWNKGMNHIDCFQAVNRILIEGGKRPLSLTDYDQILYRAVCQASS